MDEQVELPVGVYGNLYGHVWSSDGAASGGDSRGSIIFYTIYSTENWLLGSIIEIQAFLVTLIRKFHISQPDHQPQIRRAKPGMMVPLVLGEEYKGPQLPLKITVIKNT